MHHSARGYSGTDGNAVWVQQQRFYDNAHGLLDGRLHGARPPRFPQDSDLLENNNFYSNNFNAYLRWYPSGPEAAVPDDGAERLLRRASRPIPVPVGRDVIAGGNAQRRPQQPLLGQLAARRDALRRSPDAVRLRRPEQPGGRLRSRQRPAPATSVPQPVLRQQDGRGPRTAASSANGVDFWWDQGGVSIDPTLATRELLVQQHAALTALAGSVTGRSLARTQPAEQPAVQLCRQPIGAAPERAGRRSINCAARFPWRSELPVVHHPAQAIARRCTEVFDRRRMAAILVP